MVTETKEEILIEAPLDTISPNPYQPSSRVKVDPETIKKFADSILTHGLLQIPVCRAVNAGLTEEELATPHSLDDENKFEMGDGWIRYLAYKWLSENGHPEFAKLPVIIKEFTDRQMADLVMEANTIRKDLTPIEKAGLYKKYLVDFKMTQEELAKQHNITQGEISNTIRLLELPEPIQQKIISHEISETHGRTLLQLQGNPGEQLALAGRAAQENMSVTELGKEVKKIIQPKSTTIDRKKESIYDPGEEAEVADREILKEQDEDECGGKEENNVSAPLNVQKDKQPEPLAEKVTLAGLKAAASLRKVVLTELPEGVRVAIGHEGTVPFLKTVKCALADVPLKLLLDEASKK